MDVTIVGEHLRHREDPGVARLGQHVTARSGERPGRRHQPVVHRMHPAHHETRPVQVELRGGGAGEHTLLGAGRDECADGVGGQAYVGVEVDPGKRPALPIGEADGVHLARHGRLDDAYAGPPGRSGGLVGARVRDDDDVELARGRVAQEDPQVLLDHGRLVVGRDHDAHNRFAHAPRIGA
ncbi:MAG TPA: hypothetical protein VGE61_07640 [Glycomyces sp.]